MIKENYRLFQLIQSINCMMNRNSESIGNVFGKAAEISQTDNIHGRRLVNLIFQDFLFGERELVPTKVDHLDA